MTPRPPSDDDRTRKNGAGKKKSGKKSGKNGKKKSTKSAQGKGSRTVTKVPGPSEPEETAETAEVTAAATVPPSEPAPDTTVTADTPEPAVSSPALDADDRARLLAGTHHAPHAVLGAHPVPGGVAFRALRPYAHSVTVVCDTLHAELHHDGDGFFSGLLPLN
ncbi:hypothetical protein OK074_9039, partial [Actinobacteria bacterium OK074]